MCASLQSLRQGGGVTFSGAGSYIVRAMKATRRPARKRLARGADEGVSGRAARGAGERVLVEAAQRDPAEFEALYELHFERVYAFVASRVRDRATAEDVTSEVFHKGLAGLPSYEWRGVPFVAWLLRIAANAIVDHAKRAAREFPAPDDLPELVYERFVEQRSITEIAQRLGKTPGAVKQLQLRAVQNLRARMEGGLG